MLIEEERAKQEQEYDPHPDGTCIHCKNCLRKVILLKSGNKMRVKTGRDYYCGLGDFRVLKTATCRMFERED